MAEREAPLPPPDQGARERIATDLGSTLFVEAGAGSGKTSALVGRVLGLVGSGEAELASIAAITFTEKAASELRDRIRQDLESAAGEDPASPRALRCRVALDQLDAAAVGTLHAFAQRILAEHPIEAGLPPRLEVLDEVRAGVAFDERWGRFLDELLSDETLERTLLLFFATGVRPEALRVLAAVFDDNWDLVEACVPERCADPPPVRPLLDEAIRTARAACGAPCSDPADKLALRLGDLAAYLHELERTDDEVELLERLGDETNRARFKVGNLGSKHAFADVRALRQQVASAGAALDDVRARVATACARRIGSAVRAFTLAAAAERRRSGALTFHDLLVLARALLRDPVHGPAVRARLHERYRRLLLDEFQDTDPIQVDLAVRIAAADPSAEDAGSAPWDEVPVRDGHLFFVGDPKQSIYRFRRADISTFLRAARRYGTEAGGHVELTANFRSCAPVIEWANHTFAALMAEPDDLALPVASQPDYVGLDATRPAPPTGPAVAVLGKAPCAERRRADELRAAEAADVAAAIASAVGDGWSVGDGAGGWRPARLGDVAVLIPARTSLPALEDALELAGIAFRSEASSLVYSSRTIRDLLMVLRAVDDPTNRLHLVAALRTPLLACGDDDLFRFRRERGGRWSILAAQPETVPADDPVRAGLAYLRSLYEARHARSPSELLASVVDDRRLLELGFVEGRPRDLWRRVRFVVDQARAWRDATGGGLRQYLAWVDRQAAEEARVAEAVLPETDDDAVRILTVHAAKGLEFPITILSGTSSAPGNHRGSAEVVFPGDGEVGYRFGAKLRTEAYARFEPVDEQMRLHERIRLLYVACTRARDHLVVSLHRNERAAAPAAARRTSAELLVDGMGDVLDGLPELSGGEHAVTVPLPAPATPPPPYERWLAEREAALGAAARPSVVAATALGDEGGFEPGDVADDGASPGEGGPGAPTWLTGRFGTAVGRAVHGVLYEVDLLTGEGIETLVVRHCEAEGVPERARDVGHLARAALGAPPVREAAGAEHWRELYVCTPVGDRLLEGYVDLLYRSGDGLAVVDYKTAATAEAAELDRRVARYEAQGAAYALALEATTGEVVRRVSFVFLTPEGAIERELPDLGRAVEGVRALLLGGGELVAR